MYDQLLQVSWGNAKEPREKAIRTQVVEGEGEVQSELSLKVPWGVRWDFSPSTTTTSCTSGILEFFKSNFHSLCLHPELHWIPSLCFARERKCFPCPSQDTPALVPDVPAVSPFSPAPSVSSTRLAPSNINRLSLDWKIFPLSVITCPFLLSHYQFLRKSVTSFLSLSITYLHSSVTLYIYSLDCQVFFSPWSMYLVSPTRL